jgi:NitT/TauT family transport system substrate-binding protein
MNVHRKISTTTLSLSVLVAMIVVACTVGAAKASTDRQTATNVAQRTAASPRVDIKVAIIFPRLASLPIFKAATYLAKKNIWIHWVYFQSSAAQNQALASGAVDLEINSPGPAEDLNEAGQNVRMFVINWATLDWFLIGSKSITNVKGLEGKTIGISSPGTTTDILTRLAVQKAGGSPDKIREVSVGSSGARASALASGKVDAAWIASDQAYQLTHGSAPLHIIGNVSVHSSFPGYLSTGWIAPESYIQKHPDVLREIAIAQIQANRWAQNTKAFDEFAGRVKIDGITGLDPAQVQWAVQQYDAIKMFPVNGGIDGHSFAATWAIEKAAHTIDQAPAFESIADPSFQKQALKQLGVYKPPRKK